MAPFISYKSFDQNVTGDGSC